jgi:uncharacterized delta-60 repeat protein
LFNSVLSIALQADGKTLLGGFFTTISGTSTPNVARLNTDGSLDNSFNQTSGVTGFSVLSIGVHTDGKVLIGGHFTAVGVTTRNYLARLDSSGTIDTTFNPGTGLNSVVEAVLVQPDEKIIIGGGFHPWIYPAAERRWNYGQQLRSRHWSKPAVRSFFRSATGR